MNAACRLARIIIIGMRGRIRFLIVHVQAEYRGYRAMISTGVARNQSAAVAGMGNQEQSADQDKKAGSGASAGSAQASSARDQARKRPGKLPGAQGCWRTQPLWRCLSSA